MEINSGDQVTAFKKKRKLFHLHSFGLIAISEMLFLNAAAGIYVDPIDLTWL